MLFPYHLPLFCSALKAFAIEYFLFHRILHAPKYQVLFIITEMQTRFVPVLWQTEPTKCVNTNMGQMSIYGSVFILGTETFAVCLRSLYSHIVVQDFVGVCMVIGPIVKYLSSDQPYDEWICSATTTERQNSELK